jgi:hypothetical protein
MTYVCPAATFTAKVSVMCCESTMVTAVWLFSQEIIAVNDAAGLHVPAAGVIVDVPFVGATTITVRYDSDFPAGSAWEVEPALVDVQFASALLVQEGSGIVTG